MKPLSNESTVLNTPAIQTHASMYQRQLKLNVPHAVHHPLPLLCPGVDVLGTETWADTQGHVAPPLTRDTHLGAPREPFSSGHERAQYDKEINGLVGQGH